MLISFPKLFLGMTILCLNGLEAQAPPKFYVDKGACPFECCQYGKWRGREEVVLYERTSEKSAKIATVKPLEVVEALTGEVHTFPGELRVTKRTERTDHSNGPQYFEEGDVLFVYTYSGEGIYKIWQKGVFSFDYPPNDCVWIKKPQSTWWIQIQKKNGKVGWTNHGDKFDGTDGCDQPIPPIK